MDECRKIFNDMKMEASSWNPAWKDIQKYVAPTRGFFNAQPNRGIIIDHKELLDSHATWAMQVLASGMTSGLTSPSRPWFKLGISDTDLMKYKPVKKYLEEVQNIIMAVFSKSNIYGVFNSSYEELGSFGTSAFALLEDDRDLIRGKNFTCGEYYLSYDGKGRPNGFGRESWYTVLQAVDEFGIEYVSDQTRRLYENKKFGEWTKVNHLIRPNLKRNPLKMDNKNFEYTSEYWEDSHRTGEYLSQSGFQDFPIIGPRWKVTTTSDIYGKSPAWEGLGDIKMLQKLQRKKFEALDKLIDPPVQADSSVDDISVNTLPGGVTRISSNSPTGGVRPAYQINPDLNSVREDIRETKEAINKFFYTDMFLMMANDTRSGTTAREIVERHEEKLLMLGPILERIENEKLDPSIDRTFNMLNRMGALPKPPQELEGSDIKVEYISMLAQAQKMVGITGIQQVASFVGNMAAVKPEVLDVFDFDEAVTEYADLIGVTPRIIRSKEEYSKLREDRSAAQLQQQQQAQMAQMVQGAKVLSDTEVGKNSALDNILGNRA